eukprot:4984593-Pyramimonas_sp.AAC.1
MPHDIVPTTPSGPQPRRNNSFRGHAASHASAVGTLLPPTPRMRQGANRTIVGKNTYHNCREQHRRLAYGLSSQAEPSTLLRTLLRPPLTLRTAGAPESP